MVLDAQVLPSQHSSSLIVQALHLAHSANCIQCKVYKGYKEKAFSQEV